MVDKLNSGFDSLNRIHLMMNYNSKLTLNENLAIIEEQSLTRGGQKSAFKPIQVRPMPSDYLGPKGGFERSQYNNLPKEKYFEYKYNLPIIEGNNTSDLLIKTRDFFFSTGGMVAQVVLSILGAEIGAGYVFAALDGAILLNDLLLMKKEWRDSGKLRPWSEEWFTFHMADGPGANGEYGNGFLRTLEDILLLATGGIIRLIGKSAKGVYRLVVGKLGKNLTQIIEKIGSKLSSYLSKTKKLPKSIKNWFSQKINGVGKSLELLKNPKAAVQTVKKNIPKSILGGVLTYGFSIFFEKVVLPKLHGGKTEFTELRENVSDGGLIEGLVFSNPKLFPNGIKKLYIVTDKNKKFVKFVIDGSDYEFIDEKKYLLKKV